MLSWAQLISQQFNERHVNNAKIDVISYLCVVKRGRLFFLYYANG